MTARKTKKTAAKKKPAARKTAKTSKATKTAKKAKASKATAKAKDDAASSLRVNLGHIFALRPRVNTSFKPVDLNTAKHFLKDESYASMAEAARAVAEKALELNHEDGQRGTRRRS